MIKIALLGAGTVGTQVARLLLEQHDVLSARAGADLTLIGIAVTNLTKPRDPAIPRALFTTDANALIAQADVVIELIGGIEPPLTLVRQALTAGASVVTGNKALLATHGPELYELAARQEVDLYYEAAVAGAVPVVYGLRESLAGDQVMAIMGVLNGTTNFILDEMTTKGVSFESALALAQELGFAEADPSADIDGDDAAAKIAILASLAFHTRVALSDVSVTGIRSITAQDISSAARAGYVIKLIAAARRQKAGIEVRVAPTLVKRDDPLAAVHGAFNAVLFEAQAADRIMFYGRGAGGAPTASAVLSDVVAAANKRVVGGHAPRELVFGQVPILPAGKAISRFYIKIMVDDEAGVLAQITAVFARHGVSISSLRQRPLDLHEEASAQRAVQQTAGTVGSSGVPDAAGVLSSTSVPGVTGAASAMSPDDLPLVYLTAITHLASEEAVHRIVTDLAEVAGVRAVVRVLHVES